MNLTEFFKTEPIPYEGSWKSQVCVPLFDAIYETDEDYRRKRRPVVRIGYDAQHVLHSTAFAGNGVLTFESKARLKKALSGTVKVGSIELRCTVPEGLEDAVVSCTYYFRRVESLMVALDSANRKNQNDNDFVLYEALYIVDKHGRLAYIPIVAPGDVV